MQPNEIHALIQLLDDPDEGVYQHVREQLIAKGTAVLPALLESRIMGGSLDDPVGEFHRALGE